MVYQKTKLIWNKKITDADIAEIIRLRPTLTLRELATQFNVTHERIRQILLKNTKTKLTRRKHVYFCLVCSRGIVKAKILLPNECICRNCQVYQRTHQNNPKRQRYVRPSVITYCEGCKRDKKDCKGYFRNGLCNNCHQRQYYASHPAYREKMQQRNRKGSPHYEKHLQHWRKWSKNHTAHQREKYQTDPAYRAMKITANRSYYQRNRGKILAAKRRRNNNSLLQS